MDDGKRFLVMVKSDIAFNFSDNSCISITIFPRNISNISTSTVLISRQFRPAIIYSNYLLFFAYVCLLSEIPIVFLFDYL